ncbi:MAG: hypothetical protein HY942_05835 [Gammaproteobacteria bacterium]|nr:hypothetical protein [Gammaproteobacteria bacterium]
MRPRRFPSQNPLIAGLSLEPAEPLWKRVPTHGTDGRPLSDFMMILPTLRHRPRAQIIETLKAVELTLHQYGEAVVFADFNMRLNLLWVSVKPIPGICLELPAAIQARVPEALLVADRVSMPPSKLDRWSTLFSRLLSRAE